MIRNCLVLSMAMVWLSSTANADVLLGVAGPMTGPNATFGDQLKAGAMAAVDAVNASPAKVDGQKIDLSVGDDAADPRQGVAVANNFIADKVGFVVGHFNSGVSIPVSDVYAESGVLEMSPSATSPLYTDRKLWNTFRICGRNDQQAVAAVDYIAKHVPKHIAVVHDRSQSGRDAAEQVKGMLQQKGIDVGLFESINPGEKDYSALVTKLKGGHFDFLYFAGQFTEAGLIKRQANDLGLTIQMMSDDGLATNEFQSIAGPAGTGTLFTFSPDPVDLPAAKGTIDALRAKGVQTNSYALYSYAAVQVLATAMQASKSVDPRTVAAWLVKGDPIDTVVGKVAFDAKGDNKLARYEVYVWRDKGYVPAAQ